MKLIYLIASLLLVLGTCDIPRTDCQYLDEDSVGRIKREEYLLLQQPADDGADLDAADPTYESTTPDVETTAPSTTEEATVPTTEAATVPTTEAATVPTTEVATVPTTEDATVPTEESAATEVTEETTEESSTSEAPSSPDSSADPSTSSPGISTFPPTRLPSSTDLPPVLPPLDPQHSSSLSTFAVIAISILVSFAAIFTGLFFLRKYCIKKRKEDQRRLLRGSVSSEGFFYGGETTGYSDRIHDRI